MKWSPVDEALCGVEDIYRVEKSRAEKLRFEALKYSLAHHYEHNDFCRRYCQGEGIAPAGVKEPSDLTEIPYISVLLDRASWICRARRGHFSMIFVGPGARVNSLSNWGKVRVALVDTESLSHTQFLPEYLP